jgi:arylsulfatase A-like enzyme
MTGKQRSVVVATAAATIVAIGAAVVLMWGRAPARPPNVVLIVIDTLRQDKLGAYGFPHGTSPEIDRMAEQGVRFDRVIAQSSWTRPSIGSMLTSQYPRTLGIYEEQSDVLADEFVTLAEVLKGVGYTTIGATANPNINTSFNFQQGFDHYLDSTVLFRWMDATEGASRHDQKKLQSARQIFDDLLSQVKERGTPPYYLQANVMEVHEYWDPRMDLRDYESTFAGAPNSRYLAAIRLVSKEVGRFVKALGKLPDFEHTLFVIVSDHGEGLTDHDPLEDSWGHGRLLYKSQVLVPLILHATDDSLPSGRVVEAPTRLLDLMPTLLEYAGLEGVPGIAGKSTWGAIQGREPPQLPPHFVVETQWRESDAIGVYGARWAYLEHRAPHHGTDPRELQGRDVRERGSQTNQLATKPEVGEALRTSLQQWERAHPRAQATKRAAPLPAVEEEQLRALGYIE